MKCKKCGKEIMDGSMFCMYCGSKQITNCSSCETVLPDEAVFCYKCGAKVTDDISSNKEEKDEFYYRNMREERETLALLKDEEQIKALCGFNESISNNPSKINNNSGLVYANGIISYNPPKSTNNNEENYWDYIDGFKNPYGKDFYDYVKRKGISFEGHHSEHCVRQRMASMNYDRQCGGITSYPAERSEAEIFLGLFCDALLSLDDD